ncbi:unnamed protein product, partial [Ilex paraguariensis]
LHCADEDVIDGAICIFKAAIFKTNHSLNGSSLTDTRQMDAVLPLLLHLLDERDGTARAVVMLLAEYCSISLDSGCLQEILKRLASGNVSQRRNAVDVISELILISLDSVNLDSHLMWQDIANQLLECLEDEESVIQAQASNLIPIIEPSLVLPGLVRLIYLSDEGIQSPACNSLVAVLKNNNKKPEVICSLLDSLSNLCQSPDLPEVAGGRREGSKLDTDRVLKLIPEWSKTVTDWSLISGPLIDKMFMEPSNAIFVRFLSYISEHLAEAADVVFRRLLLHARQQKEIDEGYFTDQECKTYPSDGAVKFQSSLFDRLCPLLIIRLLPLRVFNELNSSLMYGELPSRDTMHGLLTFEYDVNFPSNQNITIIICFVTLASIEFKPLIGW